MVQGKFSPALNNAAKAAAWASIADAVNAAFTHTTRTIADCEARWFNVSSKTRKKLSLLHAEYAQTGKRKQG